MDLRPKSVPKSYVPKKACLYCIAHEHWYDPKLLSGMWLIKEFGYIGVTTMKIGKRFTDHTATRNGKDRHLTGPFIKENGYEFEQCVRILAEGTREEMLALEKELRPRSGMGLNKRVGGC